MPAPRPWRPAPRAARPGPLGTRRTSPSWSPGTHTPPRPSTPRSVSCSSRPSPPPDRGGPRCRSAGMTVPPVTGAAACRRRRTSGHRRGGPSRRRREPEGSHPHPRRDATRAGSTSGDGQRQPVTGEAARGARPRTSPSRGTPHAAPGRRRELRWPAAGRSQRVRGARERGLVALRHAQAPVGVRTRCRPGRWISTWACGTEPSAFPASPSSRSADPPSLGAPTATPAAKRHEPVRRHRHRSSVGRC